MVPEIPRTALLSYPFEPYVALSVGGILQTRWKRGSMPRIDDRFLECVVYLYPTVADATAGEKSGGCGFWIGVPNETPEPHSAYWQHIYVATNSHIVREASSRVLRVNKLSGGYEVIETREDEWVHHPDGDDVAIIKLDYSLLVHQVAQADLNMFVTTKLVEEINIGPGDDVFIAGRFISHDGKQQNLPSLRFGNIAMMPWEPILNQRGILQESFLVEGRSLGGASGSPVFVRVSLDLMGRPGIEKQERMGVWLLGVNWGHVNLSDADFTSVCDKSGNKHPNGWRVRVNTGMMGVVPAWKIREILDLPEQQEIRRIDEIRTNNAIRQILLTEMDQSGDAKRNKDD